MWLLGCCFAVAKVLCSFKHCCCCFVFLPLLLVDTCFGIIVKLYFVFINFGLPVGLSLICLIPFDLQSLIHSCEQPQFIFRAYCQEAWFLSALRVWPSANSANSTRGAAGRCHAYSHLQPLHNNTALSRQQQPHQLLMTAVVIPLEPGMSLI